MESSMMRRLLLLLLTFVVVYGNGNGNKNGPPKPKPTKPATTELKSPFQIPTTAVSKSTHDITSSTDVIISSGVSATTSLLPNPSKAPDEPYDFIATVNSSSTIILSWSPSRHKTGPTNYSIVVYGNVDDRTDNCTDRKEIYVPGYNTSSAVVENLCSYTVYNFTIMASTSEENSSWVALNESVQTEIGTPDEPYDFIATVNSSSTIILSWSPSKHKAGPTNYSIVVYGNVDDRTDNCTDRKEIYVPGYNRSSAVVENLCSFTVYNFTIMASTSEGNSSWVALNESVKTEIGTPDEPYDFIATVNSSSTIILSWSPSKHKAGPTNYSIVVYGNVDDRTDNCTDRKEIYVPGYKRSSAVVENLCSYTVYNFTIMASTSEGNSSWVALNESVQTEIGTPDEPYNFIATVNSSSTIILSWSPSKHKAGPTNYSIGVYGNVDHRTDKCTDRQETYMYVTGYNRSSAVLENLCSYTVYNFTIMASTSEGNSSWVALNESVQTEIGTPDEPYDFIATVKSSSTIILSWSPSKHKAGPTTYSIGVYGNVDHRTDNCTDRQETYMYVTGYNRSSAVVENLCSYTVYNFTIMASTSEGNSSWVALNESVQTEIGTPDEPYNFIATVNSSSTIILSWSPSKHKAGPTTYSIGENGNVDHRTDKCTDRQETYMYVTGYNRSSAVVENLCSYTVYNFTIMASTSEGNSSWVALNESVQTEIGTPDEPYDFIATVNSSSTIILSWSPSKHKAGPTTYSIGENGNVDHRTDNCTDRQETYMYVTGYNRSSAVVENLCSYTVYNFTIMASTSEGNSSWVALNESVQTEIGTPDEPYNFIATVNSSSTVILSWSPSKHKAGPTNYSIGVYGNVDQRTDNCTDRQETYMYVTGYNRSSAVVENLCSYTVYNFTIMASTSEGNSSWVALNESVQTEIGTPDEPYNFIATVNSSSTVILSWSPSKHKAGPTNYSIGVYGNVDHRTDNCTDRQETYMYVTGYNRSSAVVENLCSFTVYNFTIMASTSEGNSSWVALNESVQTEIGTPDEPYNFIATVNSSSTVILSWSPSKHKAGPTNYSIGVYGNVDHRTDNCTDRQETDMYVTGYNTSSAVVENLCSYTVYNFTIMASTSEGNSSWVALNESVQTEIGIPDEPYDFNATVNSSSTIILSWSPSKHKAGPTNYSIIVYGNVDQRTDNCTDRQETYMYVTGYNRSSAVVENLCSYTVYNFTIMASTSEGNSSWVALNESVQTEIGKPDKPYNFHAAVNSSSTITLSWSPSKHKAGPTNYSIVVYGKVDHRTNNCTAEQVIHVTGHDTSSVIMENLCSYTYYNFTIMAHTSSGSSSGLALNAAVQTATGKPDKPYNFHAAVNSSSTITLSWSPSKHEAGLTNYSIVVSGQVDYRTNNCTAEQVIHVTGYNTSSAIMENLCSYTYYNFTIMAHTSSGSSSGLALNAAVQTATGKPDKPFNFHAAVNSSSTITLSWSPSKHEAGLTNYSIVVSGQVDYRTNNCTADQVIHVTGHDTSSAIMENLCSYTYYNFTIMAHTSSGSSSGLALNAAVQTATGKPDKPFNFHAAVNSSSTITLSWSPSKHEAGLTNYSIVVSGQVDYRTNNCTADQVIHVTGHDTSSAIMENLCSYTYYNFTIMAHTSSGSSSGLALNAAVQTATGKPDKPFNFHAAVNSSSTITLSWSPSKHEAGLTNYSIVVSGQVDYRTNNCTADQVIHVTGHDTSSVIMENLCSYTYYNFTIMAHTSSGSSSGLALNAAVQTATGKPDKPYNFHAAVNSSSTITLSWSPSKHEAGLTNYSIVVSGQVDYRTNNCTAEQVIHVTGHDTSSVIMENLCSYTYYNFTIMAHTSSGSSSGLALNAAVQTATGKPDKPYNFHAAVNSSSTITLSWSPSKHEAGLTNYSIVVSGQVDYRTNNCTAEQVIHVTGYNTSSAIMENLCSYTYYNFTIMAHTSSGSSSGLALNAAVQTATGKPDKPYNFHAAVNSSSTITLSWSPSKHEAGLTNYSIVVSGQVDYRTNNCTAEQVIHVTGYNTSSAIMENLCSYTYYNFTIMAHTSSGSSSGLALNAAVQTATGKPDKPYNFHAAVNSSSTITLSWSPSKHEAGLTNYSIVVYGQVDYRTNNCTAEQVIHVTGYNTSSAIMENLCSYTYYNFTIMAHTSSGSSSGLALNAAVQTATGKPDKPYNFHAAVNSSSTITLSWSPSKHKAGPTNYSIVVYGKVDHRTNNCTAEQVIHVTGHDTSSVIMENLCSYTYYNFTIMAHTSSGSSSGLALNAAVQTATGKPDKPYNFHAAVNSSSTITLSWSPSKHEAGPSNYSIVVYGQVDYRTNNCTAEQVIHVTGHDTSSAIMENLCSYTYYNFTIMAHTSSGSSSGLALNAAVQTATGKPDKPYNFHAAVNSSSTITLSWSPSKHEAGLTNYSIVVSGQVDYRTNNCTAEQVIHVTGYETSSVIMENLCSYTYYNFTIMAHTSSGSSSGLALNAAVQTATGTAYPPQNLTVMFVNSSSVKLTWLPSKHQCGQTDYIIEVEEQSHLQSEDYIPNRTETVHGFHNNRIDIDNLTSYWNYRFSVCATTTVHPHSKPVIAKKQTLQSPPGRVEDIRVSALPDNYTAVKLTWECPEERKRHGPISHFTVQSSVPTHITSRTGITVSANSSEDCLNSQLAKVIPEMSFSLQKPISVPIGNNCTESYDAILTVLPEHRYNFTIVANAQFKGLEKVSDEFFAKAGRPPKDNSTKIFITASSATSDSATDSTFLVSVNTKHLRDPTNGQIVMTGLLVMSENAKLDYPENWTALKNWRGWKEWRKNYRGTYRPTPDKWLNVCPHDRRKRSTDNGGQPTAQFLVGANANCENIDSKHCNGPLEAETTYRVVSVSCTTAGCTTSAPYGPFKTKAKSIVAAVVGGLLAALTLVGIVIGGLVYRRRRNKKQQNYVDDDPENEEEHSVDLNRPKKLSDFSRLVDHYHKDSGRLFSVDWRDIGQHSPKHPNNNAKLPVNRSKNRYTNILAYDHTRVKLLPKTGEEGSDYINANYIPGYSRRREYIASQGPVPSTVDDFWQMIWEQNVPIIVQLTDLFEKGQRKLAQYWPEEVNVPQRYGKVQVEIVSLSPMNKYTIKVFKVSLGTRSRHVKHFFLQGWRDFNANLKTGDVIDFTRYVRNELKPTDKGPMVIHCSAGVGRTGTFICVDYFLQVIDKADLQDYIDIFSFVLKMRDCRPMMVQSENQFIFIHDAVKEMIERKRTALAGEEDELIYENQGFDPNEENDHNIYENM